MRLVIISFLFIVFAGSRANAQGCVAIRSTGSSCFTGNAADDSTKWQLNLNYRYFKSFRHFKGDEEQKERLVEMTDVRNWSHSIDISLIHHLTNRFSIGLNLPLIGNERSSLYEHGLVNGSYIKRERRNTSSYGLGDMRLTAYYWLVDPAKGSKGNIQLGAGIKFATGDYDYKDYWYNVGPGGTPELRTVDQSIQLGDGGTGLVLEMNGYTSLNHRLTAYGNIYYLLNPRNVNGTRTYRETLSPALANETIMSVADQYMFRAGMGYNTRKLHLSLGGRIDGIPVYDLAGKSDGFRRPGYVVSIEPGASMTLGKGNLFLNVPIALYRNRTQSVTDKEMSRLTNSFRQGDAAFSDYVFNLGYSFRF